MCPYAGQSLSPFGLFGPKPSRGVAALPQRKTPDTTGSASARQFIRQMGSESCPEGDLVGLSDVHNLPLVGKNVDPLLIPHINNNR